MGANIGSSQCPICRGGTSLSFSAPCDYRKPKDSKPYDVHWCATCNYGHVWERPTPAEVRDFYALEYYTHEHFSTQGGSANKETFFDKLRTHLSWRFDKSEDLSPSEVAPWIAGEGLSVLEIGCGNGTNLRKFLDQGFRAVGVEPDPRACEAVNGAGMVAFPGTAEDLPSEVREQKFNVVLMAHVLEHCLDVNAAVESAKGVLDEQGLLVIETPNNQAQGFKLYEASWPWSDIPRHLNFFTPTSLKRLLEKHGFEVVSEKYAGYYRQFTNSWLETEEQIWRSFAGRLSSRRTKPNFKLRAWKLLLKTVLSPSAEKYDSVRLIARRA